MINDARNELTPEQARALLTQGSQAAAATRSGANWPQIAGLLILGAGSSLALPAIVFAPSELLALPLILMGLWITISFVFMTAFSRSTKRGFGRRWVITIVIWGALWAVSIFGTSTWFAGQLWFLITSCAALTAVTIVGAWIEARR